MEGDNKLKKRGRDIEEESYSVTPTAKKQETCHHNTNNTNDELSCSQAQQLEVFDFPWLHEEEGMMMMCKSEDLFSLEDSFSSTLNHPTNYCTIAGVRFELTGESETPSAVFVPLQDKSEMWPLDAVDDHDHGLQIDGSDCIWGPLLNQPLQVQRTLSYT